MPPDKDKSFWKRIPRKWLFVGLFLILVALSDLWREYRPHVTPLREGQKTLVVHEYTGALDDENRPITKPTGREIGLAVTDIPGSDPAATPVVILHNTPGDSTNVAALAESLRGRHRLIVPDLPGTGASEKNVADHSIRATARTTLDLLDRLGVKDAHILGVGMGGGAALEIAHAAPERTRSLALLSSVGSQEYDLLGNHLVNKIVYTFQMAGLKVFEDWIPHFGLLDGLKVNKAYARTLWESDLTTLKSHLRHYQGPLLLAHGENDWLVAADTAHYSKRLAPHAATLFVPGGHDVFLADPKAHAGELLGFLDAAESGKAALGDKSNAEQPAPKPAAAEGSRKWVLLLIILLCTLVAEDPTCLATGLLVGLGLIDFWSGTMACLLGIFIGDLALYLVGRILGRAALTKAPFKWFISEYEVDRMSKHFGSTKGMAVIVTSRFIPGSRVPTFVSAGIMKLNPAKLGFLFFIAAALWTPPLIWFAEKAGDSVMERFDRLHHLAGYIAVGLLLGIFIVFHFVVPAFTWKGRRQLLVKGRRWTHHANLPGFLHAIPGFFHGVWLALRHGGPGMYAAANPTLGRLGGAAGESKAELIAPFADAPAVVTTTVIPADLAPEARADLVDTFAKEHGGYPVFLKPTRGENGAGAHRIDDRERALAWFTNLETEAVVQPLVTGREYEVVWHRAPGEKTGRILGVVEKLRPAVVGDGKHTLEHLILADDVAVNHTDLFLRLNAGKEDAIPAAGEHVVLTAAGSLGKGARVAYRPELSSAPAAAAAIDELAARHPGVHWLRLDIFAADDADFLAAKNWRITEIEGAGKYSSLLRDPNIRPADAILLRGRQRAACHRTGAENRAKSADHRRPSAFDLLATASESKEIRDPFLR